MYVLSRIYHNLQFAKEERKLNRVNSNKIFANKRLAGCKNDGSRIYMNLFVRKTYIIPILFWKGPI